METMQAIIDNCKKVKNEKGYTYDYIAEQSGIPKSTVERFFSTKGASCRYDTIYPIVRFLSDFDEETPATPAEMAKELPLPANQMLDWYKEAIIKREQEFEALKEEYKQSITALKAEHKETVGEYKETIANHRKTNRILFTVLMFIVAVVFAFLVCDIFFISEKGWFIR